VLQEIVTRQWQWPFAVWPCHRCVTGDQQIPKKLLKNNIYALKPY